MSTDPSQTANAPTAAALLPQVPFPATWKASLSHWWSSNADSGYSAQNSLIQRGLEGTGITFHDYSTQSSDLSSLSSDQIQPVTAPIFDQKIARLRRIDLGGGKDRILNVLEVGTRERKAGEHTFLVLHGYGGAFAFYWQNLATLCSFPNTRLYFMDMLGMGLSGRPKFPTIKLKGDPHTPTNVQSRVEQAEAFFIDSFEDFRTLEKIEKFTMIGHSLGGYLSTAYAFKYPQRINKLVLVSPVGVPKSPYESEEEEIQKAGVARQDGLDREFEEDQLDTTRVAPTKNDQGFQGSATTEFKPKPRPKPPSSWWTHLWEANVSPFSLVRLSSFAGPKLVSKYAARRFALFNPDVQSELFNYLYSVYGQRGSGEYCLAHLLSPGAFARAPLIDRFGKLNPKIPVSFIYGDSDWMDKKGGADAVKFLKARIDASEIMKTRSKVLINDHAGHWTFLDNPEGMNRIFKDEMREALKDHP